MKIRQRKMSRKILYSPGYGAGWVSWYSGPTEAKQFMLTYQPWIEAIESGLDPKELVHRSGLHTTLSHHPLAEQFEADWEKNFPERPLPCILGVEDLAVATVHGSVRISEYDGSESYHEGYDDWL